MSTPKSVLIVGSGVFGLGTAHALALRPEFKNTSITVLERVPFPAQDAASIDSSRVVRADYAELPYAQLMTETMPYWKGEWGRDGRFTQSGLAIVADDKKNLSDEEAAKFLNGIIANLTEKLGLKVGKREEGADVTIFSDREAAKQAMGKKEGYVGSRGMINWTSGWAHAEDGIKYMRKKIDATGRVDFKTAEIKRLLFNNSQVDGVELLSGEKMTADLTILATGAWTPTFLDLRGIASATGQVLTYIDITKEEEERYSAPGTPVLINESDGMFIIPPRNRVLKVARHGYGYANPITFPNPENPNETLTVSLPRTKLDDPNLEVPSEGTAVCRRFLRQAIPPLGERPFTYTRICWYTDTPTGDFLVAHHPKYKGLFVATGGSGHAYKFLPTIGERVVDVLQGRDRDELGRELRERWAWPKQRAKEDHCWTEDWRGAGVKGMILDEEYRKDARGAGSKL